MAAYAAVVSLGHIIEQIQHHPRPPISLDKKQVQSLTEKVTFLQDFLENYSNGGSKRIHGLETRISDAAYAAEDIIESYIADQILAGSTRHRNEINLIDLYQGREKVYLGLQEVVNEMEFIEKEVMEIKAKAGIDDQLQRNLISASLLRSPTTVQNMMMVGFDNVMIEVMDKLTRPQTNRQIIPIVGMGGIGKTTLARNIYVNPLIVQHFDILAWVTISQEYSTREILLEVLLCVKKQERSEELVKLTNNEISKMSEEKLGETLHKCLSGMRYLIIMDDIWSIEVWDDVKFFFPDCMNGSRIVITTRLSNVAFELSGSHGIELNFLDEDQSWNLLRKNVFGEAGCPLELVGIGKKIAKNCKGLPLLIVVIGGLLAKSKQTRGYWEYIVGNLNSNLNLKDDECCFKILYMSYNQLPVHLKPCFLYMGVFPEDSKIRVSDLVKLWIAEGILKPIKDKSFEAVAEECLNELISRNLILAQKRGSNGKIKSCNIHDLLRDLCLREAERDNFLCVTSSRSLNIKQGLSTKRRISIHQSTSNEEYFPRVTIALQSASRAKSLICDSPKVLTSLNFRLLKYCELSIDL